MYPGPGSQTRFIPLHDTNMMWCTYGLTETKSKPNPDPRENQPQRHKLKTLLAHRYIMLLSIIEVIKGCWIHSTRVHKLLNYKIAQTTLIYWKYVCKLNMSKIWSCPRAQHGQVASPQLMTTWLMRLYKNGMLFYM